MAGPCVTPAAKAAAIYITATATAEATTAATAATATTATTATRATTATTTTATTATAYSRVPAKLENQDRKMAIYNSN